jgi:hypothetical protein
MCARPGSFILVGDSGEQDLELYVCMAQQYPSAIKAIYIRDVTTPDVNTFGPPSKGTLRGMMMPRMLSVPTEDGGRPSLGLRSLSSTGMISASRWATTTGQQRPPKRGKSQTVPPVPSTASAPPLLRPSLSEPCSDALSFNNPLSGPPSSAGASSMGGYMPEARRKLVESFYARVAEAERALPKHVVLRLFKNGEECIEETVRIVKDASAADAAEKK